MSTDEPPTFNEMMRDLRDQAGLTAVELARRAGESKHWVYNRQNNKTAGWSFEDLQKWARACGRDVSLAFPPAGESVVLTADDPEAIRLVRLLLEGWGEMSEADRSYLKGVVQGVCRRER